MFVLQNSWQQQMAARVQRGQGVVEFALTLPVLVLLIAGIIDLSNAYQTYVALTNAAEEGAQYAMTKPTDTAGICQRVKNSVPPNITLNCTNNVKVEYTKPTPSGCTPEPQAKCPVQVTVTYQLNSLLGAPLGFGTIPLSTSVQRMMLVSS